MKRYSIAEARQNLAAIVHELENAPQIELTRRGEPVAVLLSLYEYQRLNAPERSFWSAYMTFREQLSLDDSDVNELLHDIREYTPGRVVVL